jgi:hypothetical protein
MQGTSTVLVDPVATRVVQEASQELKDEIGCSDVLVDAMGLASSKCLAAGEQMEDSG